MRTDPFAYQDVVQLAYSGNVDEARNQLIQMLPKTQEHDFICNTGVSLWQIGQYELAEMCYRRALEISEVPAIWFNLTVTLDDAGRTEDAKDSLRSFIRLVETRDEMIAAMEMLIQNGKTHLASLAIEYTNKPTRNEKVKRCPLPRLKVMFFPESINESRASGTNPEVIKVYSTQVSAAKAFPLSTIQKTTHAKRELQKWLTNHAASILLNGKFNVRPFQLIGPPVPEFICAEHEGTRYFLQEDGSWQIASLTYEIVPYPWQNKRSNYDV